MTNNLLAQAGQIVNPVLSGTYGKGGVDGSGANIATLLATFIRVMVIIGGLGFVLYFVIGAVNWITSGGDKGKLQTSKEAIINALTGLVILLALVAITTFLKEVFQIDLLNISWPTPGGAAPTTAP